MLEWDNGFRERTPALAWGASVGMDILEGNSIAIMNIPLLCITTVSSFSLSTTHQVHSAL